MSIITNYLQQYYIFFVTRLWVFMESLLRRTLVLLNFMGSQQLLIL